MKEQWRKISWKIQIQKTRPKSRKIEHFHQRRVVKIGEMKNCQIAAGDTSFTRVGGPFSKCKNFYATMLGIQDIGENPEPQVMAKIKKNGKFFATSW